MINPQAPELILYIIGFLGAVIGATIIGWYIGLYLGKRDAMNYNRKG